MTSFTLESCTASIRKRIGEDCGLGASLKLDFGDTGVIVVDGSKVPNVVTNEDQAADCTIVVTLADFEAMVKGDLLPMNAFMSGKIQVDGDMSIAMKLQELI